MSEQQLQDIRKLQQIVKRQKDLIHHYGIDV